MPIDETLLEENDRLRRHVAELTRSLEEERQRVADGQRALAEERAQVLARREVEAKKAEIELLNAALTEQIEKLRSREIFLQELIDANPSLIVARDLSGKILVSNKAFDAFLGSAGATLRGKTYEELLPKHQLEMALAIDREVLTNGQPVHAERIYPREGGDRIHQALRFVIHDARGVVCALGGVSTDITEQRRAEEARQSAMEELAQHQARIIEAQRAVLREISTPLIPLSSQVVLLPLIGTIDAQRAAQAMETLLAGIEQHRASVTIIDVTGVPTIDKPIADDLLRAAQAARLLGVEVIVTGIQPRIAQILVELGIDLRGLVTRSTLEEGIEHATGRRGREAPRAGG